LNLVIKGGRVVDPANGVDKVTDIFVQDDKIAPPGKMPPNPDVTIDGTGLVVVPGLVDMHVHLREPGNEEEETIASGTESAAAGGITSCACMPNTEPAIDNEATAEFVILQSRRAAKSNVFPIGAVTKGRKGEQLAEMGGLVRGGALAFSDDGDPVANAEILRRALLYAKIFGKPVINHCENRELAGKGVMNSGMVSMTLGLSGMSSASEEIMLARDLTLAEITGGSLHVAHVSTAGSVELVRRAKQKGINVTCEATPHHFTLTDECVETFDSNYKVNPPLRTEADLKAIKAGLADGTIDAIASDHAPHSEEEKDVEFSFAPFGIVGMETLLPLVITELVRPGLISLDKAVELMSVNPARILGLERGTLSPGAVADITVMDIDTEWGIDINAFLSKSRNSPFHGRKVFGRAVKTVVSGKVVFDSSLRGTD
jgi:dihydroorotase